MVLFLFVPSSPPAAFAGLILVAVFEPGTFTLPEFKSFAAGFARPPCVPAPLLSPP